MRTLMHLKFAIFILSAATAQLLGACNGSTDDTLAPPALAWTACTEEGLQGLECATLIAPKDYKNFAKGSFSLAVVRAKSTGPTSERIGTLFFNPGGPGESGVSLGKVVAAALPQELRTHFDFVTWDPRGVGRSSGLSGCTGGSYTLPATGPVNWGAVVDQMRTSEKTANEACAGRYADVVPYISTNATVRDLDRLRQAVGDSKLTYWGTSYGTRIGYVYAHDYPDRVRAMLLTSPISPNATWPSFALGAGTAPDDALGFFFGKEPAAKRDYDSVITSLNTQALTLPSGAQVTHWDIQGTVASTVTSQSSYVFVASLLATVNTALIGTTSEQAQARATLDSMEWPTSYPINGGATAFIGCLDYPQRLTRAEQVNFAEQIRTQAPIFGFGTSQGLFYCEGVNVPPDPVPVNFTNSQTPMLIMGSTHDALTQYSWATELSHNFLNSRVVTYDGTQHTPFLSTGSTCVDTLGIDYLVRLTRPDTDVSCPYVAPLQ
jgi:pimeloyl-ACP methyl ester carboxylesterase